ncbi:hypothetical protein FNV43_RR18734 [Rhamnella rubrinervis]|uniref:Protein CPR-5 n=1 Tax=Rhamnella rubrinervis TaxID=2594499 RepID=A0A8K0DZX5_9ROSA|nr:hypothetical protein FNV43_RR18734 [Rhamnella rubrinervis]
MGGPSLPSSEPNGSSACFCNEETNNAENEEAAATVGSSTGCLNPTVQNPLPSSEPSDENPEKLVNRNKKKVKKRPMKDVSASQSPSSSSSLGSLHRGTRVASKRRNARIVFGALRRNPVSDAISFRLGMSIAAFVAQVLDKKDVRGEGMSADHLAMICASAVRESLANDFGDTFDSFVKNFEKSFGSTLRTLKLIKESSVNKENHHRGQPNLEGFTSDVSYNKADCICRRGCTSSPDSDNHHSEAVFHTNVAQDGLNHSEAIELNEVTDSINLDLALHGQTNQVICFSPNPFRSTTNQSMLSTIEKSVIEQARSNDLKSVELGLTMRRLKMKETQLALNFDSNHLERSKLAMNISKASFKAEKFKSQLEDDRYCELLRKFIDCLVAGLFLMVSSLLYGTYVFSYKRIIEATASCTPSPKESRSWWIPNPMSSFNSGLHILMCQVQVVSRMLFGILVIIVIAYLLLQRSTTSRQTMPVTFILLLLGVACGFAGKLCIDTLGGSGYLWLMYWETFCLVHFFCNVYTSTLFFILYGPVTISQGTKCYAILPYWIRRCTFYGVLLLFLPLFCGLLPFASFGEWKDHFWLLLTDYFSVGGD